jgi:hypothetical protein
MNTVTITKNILNDDKLISLIKSNFNESDLQLFELNYKIYTTNKNNIGDFIVDLDEVYKWIGFKQKCHAKRLLESKNVENKSFFEINKDYIIKKGLSLKGENLGGRPSNQILLTINCFKKFCLKASTLESEKIYDYYIKMEDIVIKYIEIKHYEIIKENNNNKQLLELKDNETNKLLELKNQQMENNKMLLEESLTRLYLKNLEIESFKNKRYEEIKKDKHVYVFSCDKPNIFKIGKSKDILQRKKQLQTGNVDNIIILHDCLTSNDNLLEQIIHYILDSYRCKSNGEHFTANLEYTKIIIDIAETFLDTLKSTYEYITKEELLQKINENILKLNNNNIIKSEILPITENIINTEILSITESIITNNLDSPPQIPEPVNFDNSISIQNPINNSSISSTDINIKNYPLLNYGSKNSYRIIRTCQLCNTVLKMSDSELYKHQLTYKCSKLRNVNR